MNEEEKVTEESRNLELERELSQVRDFLTDSDYNYYEGLVGYTEEAGTKNRAYPRKILLVSLGEDVKGRYTGYINIGDCYPNIVII